MTKDSSTSKYANIERVEMLIREALLKKGNIVIPDFGYLELINLVDRYAVLFKSANSKFYLQMVSAEEKDEDTNALYEVISNPLKDEKVVNLPKIGIFRPIIHENGKIHVLFTLSSSLRKLINENQGKEGKNEIKIKKIEAKDKISGSQNSITIPVNKNESKKKILDKIRLEESDEKSGMSGFKGNNNDRIFKQKSYLPYMSKRLKYMAIILSTVVVFANSSFRLGLYPIYYTLVISFLILILLMKNQKFKIMSFSMFFLYIACFTSIVFNDIPHYYAPEQRFLMFICVTVLLGPFIGSKQLIFFRKKMFQYTNIIIVIFSTLSYLGLATGIYRGVALNRYGEIRADFTGFFATSMLLSPMAGIATFSCLYYSYLTNNKNMKYFLLICALLCFLSAVTAGSRSALIGLIMGFLFFFFILYKNNFGKYIKIILGVLMIGIISFPLWEERTNFLMKKITASEDNWSSTRDAPWQRRIMEFERSPIIGVGFASEDIMLSDNVNAMMLEKLRGGVEPGSSWLAILSMTGILGFIPVFIIFINNYLSILKEKRNRLWYAYLGGILTLFTLHMFAEGYIFAFGGILFFYLWLLLGVIQITKIEYQ